MFPIESTGASALARGSPSTQQLGFSTRSGAGKAQALQSGVTSAQPAAPVETARAVTQAQAAQKSRLSSEARRPVNTKQAQPPSRNSAALSLSKPMTAVLLHELRLQQELADVQEQKGLKEQEGR
ncbi:hypothetical protein RXV86_16980 [Alisedimentitalea sp. MJ-SS2]|uniref:hypothetical protein n=1 Tax=Aliisedimentitalea sp. MJ-SS2 TaxID=3049795 RepID=UPI00290BA613|nr:hypothetical protein [Alisedimentitalea sp. MJ-SS2]MDU8929090.1 hypothetical protein [Alisedimentitalea sp. MJ-SS2]